jgi:hypothetical protein
MSCLRPHFCLRRGSIRGCYPFHDKAVTVTTCGRICFNRQKVNLSRLFAAKPSSSNKPKIGFGSSA